ncbi:helix-turn-helix transcriptional regulator [Allokutzneria oryzae]|uniref:Helix-turn-helix transcriptional regulator n=1 Tax=Allokutzneria oryzae TaxID=1378989 RepID=A0ABV6A917_9PSEU
MTYPDAEASTTRARILAVLRNSAREMTVAEVAEQLMVHPNTVRFHLDGLTERGQVEQVRTPPRGPGRPAVRVRAVAAMDPAGPRHYRVLAEVLTLGLADTPDPAERAQRAGRQWGGRLVEPDRTDVPATDPVSRLTEVLGELGFAPERTGASEISLRHCPFLELAASARDVVCPVHLGLMQGALDALESDFGVERLEPFVRPDLCLVHLTKKETAA